MASSIASASVAGDSTRSSSRIVPSSSTTPPAILVPPTSTPQVSVIARPPRAGPRRSSSSRSIRSTPAAAAARARRARRWRAARPPPAAARRRRRPGAPAPPGWSGGRRARCGRSGSRCTRRAGGEVLVDLADRRRGLVREPAAGPGRGRSPWSRAQPESAPRSLAASSETLPTGSSGSPRDRRWLAHVVLLRRSSRLDLGTAPAARRRSTRAPATRCRARPAGRVRSRRYDPTVTTSSSPLRGEVDLGPGDVRQRPRTSTTCSVPACPRHGS